MTDERLNGPWLIKNGVPSDEFVAYVHDRLPDGRVHIHFGQCGPDNPDCVAANEVKVDDSPQAG